jgi:hypothetical protein
MDRMGRTHDIYWIKKSYEGVKKSEEMTRKEGKEWRELNKEMCAGHASEKGRREKLSTSQVFREMKGENSDAPPTRRQRILASQAGKY